MPQGKQPIIYKSNIICPQKVPQLESCGTCPLSCSVFRYITVVRSVFLEIQKMALSRASSDENVITNLICKATRAHAFADPKNIYFSQDSAADIFEVASTGGVVRSNVRNDDLRDALQVLSLTTLPSKLNIEQADAPATRKELRTRVMYAEKGRLNHTSI